ncbi:uroporphyrinogen-III C-methyltransferase [Methanofollis fontis]|uniref:uroporphyrinogen-III C-methyltransferase n=1 Tax=Methanofollis fontis TaxID=2052832 RepID=A0A483CNZ4_9EURY|nr:uroporphyrinogen-III C-methyltransferase [Methanofollis fontis]TAJ44782.1 uroporphyrinogen-III C-methyltransferase [Methanofollis fontis]
MSGKVTLVGSGPGGCGLLTPDARQAIEAAEVIFFDQLPGEEVLAALPADAEKIDCGKFGSAHTLEQQEIEDLMIRHAQEGRKVVRLKGGDPFLFGRGGEEMEALRAAGIEVAIVPGITSAIAVPESVGIPVTHRRFASQVTIITGHEDPTKDESALDWRLLAQSRGTIVVLMGVKNLPQIAASLVENGRSPETPVAIIERGMRPDQRVSVGSLATIADVAAERGVSPPAVIVIGEVVGLYDGSTLYRP